MYSIIILHALQFGVHSEQWVGHVYVTNIIVFAVLYIYAFHLGYIFGG